MFQSKQFRHIATGEIVTQVPISRLSEYEEVLPTAIDNSTTPHTAYVTPAQIAQRQKDNQTASDFINSHFIIAKIK